MRETWRMVIEIPDRIRLRRVMVIEALLFLINFSLQYKLNYPRSLHTEDGQTGSNIIMHLYLIHFSLMLKIY
jgi:hypothetical protein